MPSIIDAHKDDFQSVVDHFQKDLQGLRTGRASAGLIESVRVEVYGQNMDLRSVASITVQDAKTIHIEPWDKSIVKDIEKALTDASLGMQPNVAGSVIRLIIPPMTEENRNAIVKILHQKEEQTKIGLRNVREKIRTQILQDEKDKKISEDEKHRQLEQLDKITGDWSRRVETLTAEKEKDILTV